MKDSKQGITRVELLVVAAILAIMVSMFFPAVRVNRESARRTDCANRLRQCALAQHNYHDSNKRLAPASLVGNQAMASTASLFGKHQWSSALLLAAPYMEMESISSLLPPIAFDCVKHLNEMSDAKSPKYRWPGDFEKSGEVLSARVVDFECPSDSINDDDFIHPIGFDMTLTCYVPIGEPGKNDDKNWAGYLVYFANPDFRVMRTNYIACIGAHGHTIGPERNRWKGCMSPGETVTLSSIADGTSRTIMFGENIGGIFNNQRGLDLDDDDPTQTEAGWGWSWAWGSGVQGRGNIPYDSDQLTLPIKGHDDPADDDNYVDHLTIQMLGNNKFAPTRGFGATHPAGVNVALADGSVRNLNRGLNWKVLYELCGARDGGIPIIF